MTLDVEKRLTAEECFEDHEHRHDRSGAPGGSRRHRGHGLPHPPLLRQRTSEFGEEIKLSRPVSTLLNRDTRRQLDGRLVDRRARLTD